MVNVIIVSLGLFVVFFAFLWAWRVKAEKRSITAVMQLTEQEKHYINIALSKGRIEISDQESGDARLVQSLVDREWLDCFSDGVLVPGHKSEYIQRMSINS